MDARFGGFFAWSAATGYKKEFPPEESEGISLTLKTTNMKSVDLVYTNTYVDFL